jgi:tetratricopeptide (TPR) repeat protein
VSEPKTAPKRLLEQDDAIGSLLRQAEEEFRDGLDANLALRRQRLRQRPWFHGSWLLASAAAGAAICLLALRPWHRGLAEASPTAEQLGSRAEEPAERAGAIVSAEPLRALPLSQPSRPLREAVRVDPKPRLAPVANLAPESTDTAAPVEPAPAAPERDCLAFARSGDPQAAAACFNERASGSGLSAQVALYELSRLERDALGKPAQALSTLDRYLERFPSGSLNGEARFSRLELLTRLGRTQEALEASAAFLSSSFGAERAAEVHLLRGNLLLRQGQSASAAVEYRAALDAPGRVGDDAAYQLAVAYEASDAQRARAAYERYLQRPSARHAAAAKARLAELSK